MRVKRGTIREERPDLLKYLVNEEDGELTCGSGKKIEVKCPECNRVRETVVVDLSKRGFSCDNIQCHLCKNSREYLYNENDIINGLKIIKQTHDGKHKFYIVKCINDGYEYKVAEYNLKNGVGCGVCSSNIVVKGINDIATTHPELLKYFVNINDAYTLSYGSGKKIKVRCPICKSEKQAIVGELVNQGFSCSMCGDGNSYPNKFMECLIRQSGFEFFTEKRFDWSTNKNTYKIYDIYIPSLNCIIENHGGQHYLNSGFVGLGGRTLKEEQINDKLKKEMAFKNGIQNYFEIDCRKSSLNWIKRSVIKSRLLDILQLKKENINWEECHKYAINSKVPIVCKLWNNGYLIKEISDNMNISVSSVLKYIKQGNELKFCNYNPMNSQKRRRLIEYDCYNAKMIYIDNKIFKSITKANKYYNTTQIGNYLNGTRPMPQKYIDLGLRYATEEDINTYESYSEN